MTTITIHQAIEGDAESIWRALVDGSITPAYRVTDWTAIGALYDGLVDLTPSTGAGVARAAAHLRAFGADAADAALDTIDVGHVAQYQPYWVVSSEIARARDDRQSAADHLSTAIGLTSDPGVAEHLAARLDELSDRRGQDGAPASSDILAASSKSSSVRPPASCVVNRTSTRL